MLETVVLLQSFVETMIRFIFQDSLMNRKLKRTAFKKNRIFCNIINVFTVTLGQIKESLLNLSISFFQKIK